MRRHDLAQVRDGAALRFRCGTLDAALSARVAAWIAAGRPMVVARQPADGANVLLGLTLPAAEGRRRIGCLVDHADLMHVRAPPTVFECLHRLADDVAAPLATLASRLADAGVRVGVYGSLAWEALSGEIYRHLESDVDLICDVSSCAEAEISIRLLAAAAARLPCRLDGEVRFPNGWAVAWRELAVAWGNADARLLVKGNADVGLSTLSAMLEQFERDALHA